MKRRRAAGSRRQPPARPQGLVPRLLRAALWLPAAKRDGFVRRNGRSDPAAVEEVLANLRALDEDDEFLTRSLLPHEDITRTPTLDELRPAAFLLHVVDDRYELRRLLGQGATGAVFAAHDRRRGTEVAVKVMPRMGSVDDEAFRRETAVLRAVDLPHVVALLQDGQFAFRDRDWSYLAMELVDGDPFPGRRPEATWPDLARAALGLFEALAGLHAHGVVHRDLKPANVMVTPDGRVVLLDVGASGGPEGAASAVRVAGTLEWMAPEQRSGREADVRTDLYGAALLVLSALTGRTPSRVLEGPERKAPPVASVAPGVPTEVAAILDRTLAPDPGARPADALEVLAVLRAATGDAAAASPFAPADARPRRAEELEALFTGPTRIHHLPDDAARELWLRTGGTPAAVVAELGAWERAGLARRVGARFSVTRRALTRLGTGLASGAAVAPRDGVRDAAEDEVLSVAVWAGPGASDEVLARIVDRPVARVRARLDALRGAGRLGEAGGRRVARGAVPASAWPRRRQDLLRRRIVEALPLGSPGRLVHLTMVGSAAEVAEDALARSTADPVAYGAGLALGFRALRGQRGGEAILARLVRARVASALSANDAATLADALRDVELADGADEVRRRARAVLRAAVTLTERDAVRAVRELEQVQWPDDEPMLGDVHRVRASLAPARSPAEADQSLAAALAWAERCPEAGVRSAALDWAGWAAYRAQRWHEAAGYHLRRAAGEPSPLARAQARVNAASALVEDGDLDGADREAALALEELRAVRSAMFEAQAEFVRRGVAYRRGLPTAPDMELVEAAEELGRPQASGPILVQEAAIAWRTGAPALARRLASAAASLWAGAATLPGAVLARALVVAAEPSLATDADVDALERDASHHAYPGIRAQALALIATARPALAPRLASAVSTAVAALDRRAWECRREVMSPAEALRAVDAPPPDVPEPTPSPRRL